MFAADADLQIRPVLAAAFDRHFHQLPHALDVQHLERVVLQDAGLVVGRQEFVLRILAAERERCLSQVVGAEREKLRVLAMRPARRQARTTSSMEPNLNLTLMPWVSSTTLWMRCTLPWMRMSSSTVATCGTMISG